MKRPVLYSLLALVPLALPGCSQNGVASAAAQDRPPATEEWIPRAAAVVAVSDDAEKVWDCEFVTTLAVPDGWDGELQGLSAAEERAVQDMRRAAARLGGNFVLLIPGETPSAEVYLCTE